MDPLRPNKIKLHCAEGRYSGKTDEFTGPSMLAEANGRLATWRREAPPVGHGYDKVDCWVYFCEDALHYYLRIDLQRDQYTTVGRELLRTIRFFAGEYRPPHFTEEQYASFLRQFPQQHENNRAWLASIDAPYFQMDL